MKFFYSLIDSPCLLSLLLPALCLVLSSQSTQALEERPYWLPSLREPFLQDYYDISSLNEPAWKRAPSASFYGMRGKKVPSSNFYGMRGKKGPSGFLGMRGKKMAVDFPLSHDQMMDYMSQPHVHDELSNPLRNRKLTELEIGAPSDNQRGDEGDLSKRVPGDGFLGMRGKRSGSSHH